MKQVLLSMNRAMKPNSYYELCSAYKVGKSYRLSFSNMHVRSPKPFDIVHVNLWTPSLMNSIHNMRYFFTFC